MHRIIRTRRCCTKTPAMIARGLADVQDCKPAVSRASMWMRGLEPVSFYPAKGVCFRSSSWTSLAAMTSRDEAHPGARASRPHNSGKASPNSSTRVDRQRRRGSASAGPMRFPPAVIAGKPSGTERWCMRAGRPRSRVGASSNRSCSPREHTPACRSADRVDAEPSRFGPSCHFADHSFFVCFRQVPPPPWGADHARMKLPEFEDEPPMDTNERE